MIEADAVLRAIAWTWSDVKLFFEHSLAFSSDSLHVIAGETSMSPTRQSGKGSRFKWLRPKGPQIKKPSVQSTALMCSSFAELNGGAAAICTLTIPPGPAAKDIAR